MRTFPVTKFRGNWIVRRLSLYPVPLHTDFPEFRVHSFPQKTQISFGVSSNVEAGLLFVLPGEACASQFSLTERALQLACSGGKAVTFSKQREMNRPVTAATGLVCANHYERHIVFPPA